MSTFIENESIKEGEKICTPANELDFNRANVESLVKNIKLVDSDPENGLDLFCYIKCDNNDNKIIQESRGVVFEGDNIIMKGFPHTLEYKQHDLEIVEKEILDVFDKCLFFDSHEGSLIRMFWFKNKWYSSTHRKLDFFKSKWASRDSFGSSFVIALETLVNNNEKFSEAISGSEKETLLEKFQSILDTSKQYMFLLLNNSENRLVSDPPESPTIFHVGTFIDGTLSMDEDIYVPYPNKHKFKDVDALFYHVDDIDFRIAQGIIIFTPDNTQYKIYNKSYYNYYTVRGNESSIKYRYLQVRLQKDASNIMHFLYPDSSKDFDEYEDSIKEIGKNIYASYIDRFIRKQYVTVPVEEFNVIKECHSWHIEERLENRISLNKVMDVLNRQTPTNLNRMIRHLKMEKNKINSGDGTTVQKEFVRKPFIPNKGVGDKDNGTAVHKEFVRKPFIRNNGDNLNKDDGTAGKNYHNERRIPLLKR